MKNNDHNDNNDTKNTVNVYRILKFKDSYSFIASLTDYISSTARSVRSDSLADVVSCSGVASQHHGPPASAYRESISFSYIFVTTWRFSFIVGPDTCNSHCHRTHSSSKVVLQQLGLEVTVSCVPTKLLGKVRHHDWFSYGFTPDTKSVISETFFPANLLA